MWSLKSISSCSKMSFVKTMMATFVSTIICCKEVACLKDSNGTSIGIKTEFDKNKGNSNWYLEAVMHISISWFMNI